ncbi:MAG TPA: AraC family transcriptional regulator, partial [Planctomycetaceae bacterium]|nr:AraC family transcriptional regulator [Planctomycetaceae bacterium]
MAVHESLRWGDPSVIYAPEHHLIWAVPLMHNAEVLGGLVAAVPETRLFPARDGRAAMDVRKACADLRRLAEKHNLTNAALLQQRREQYRHEQLRAQAIHELKLASSFDLRRAYLHDEPELIAAIRAGDRGAARAVLNRILSAIHYHTGERFELTKSFFMELVATVCRTAVEAGGDPEQLLGTNFACIAQLSRIHTLEELAPWLHQTLERVLDNLYRHRFSTHTALLARAVDYLQQHFAEDIRRDDVARVAHLSPSHFSRLFRRHTGQTFTEVLVRLRIRRATELLSHTDKPIALVAAESGFSDQSHFTKTFRKLMGVTPRQFRK